MNSALRTWNVDSAIDTVELGSGIETAKNLPLSRISLLLGALSLLYAGLCIACYTVTPSADEAWYLLTATEFAQGHFMEAIGDEIVAPGYPLFLAGMLKAGLPLWALKGFNVLFLIVGIWFLHKTGRLYLSERVSLTMVAIIGLHPLLLRWVPYLMTECFAFFCMTSFLFFFCSLLQRKAFSWRLLLLAAASFAILSLTRTIFGYVALAGIVMSIGLGIIHRKDGCRQFLRACSALILALLMCGPYLIGTYALTGKAFYWSSYGGGLLYWISSPYSDERGDWHSIEHVRENPILADRHLDFLTAVEALPLNEREAAYRTKAFDNIRQNPVKLVQNITDNVSRLLFGTPRSFESERVTTHIYIWPHVCAVLLGALSVFVVARRWEEVPPAIRILALLALAYVGASVLLPAMPRFLVTVLPIAALWLAYVFTRLVRVQVDLAPRSAVRN